MNAEDSWSHAVRHADDTRTMPCLFRFGRERPTVIGQEPLLWIANATWAPQTQLAVPAWNWAQLKAGICTSAPITVKTDRKGVHLVGQTPAEFAHEAGWVFFFGFFFMRWIQIEKKNKIATAECNYHPMQWTVVKTVTADENSPSAYVHFQCLWVTLCTMEERMSLVWGQKLCPVTLQSPRRHLCPAHGLSQYCFCSFWWQIHTQHLSGRAFGFTHSVGCFFPQSVKKYTVFRIGTGCHQQHKKS